MKLTTFTECNFSDIDFSKVNYENGTIAITYIQDYPRFKKMCISQMQRNGKNTILFRRMYSY